MFTVLSMAIWKKTLAMPVFSYSCSAWSLQVSGSEEGHSDTSRGLPWALQSRPMLTDRE